MQIQIKLFATLMDKIPDNAGEYPISKGTKVADIVEALKIDPADVALIFINSTKKSMNTELQNGDRLGLFPPVGGG